MRFAGAGVLVVLLVSCAKGDGDAQRAPKTGAQDAGVHVRVKPDQGYDAEALGSLRFDVPGGTPSARREFTHGLLALHSFWYEEATKRFQAAVDADPSFAMAYWGLAMSKSKLLWGDDDLRGGRAALAQIPMRSRLGGRERDWIAAAETLFAKGDVRASRARFAAAMKGVHELHPDDESTTLLAAALLAATRPGDPDHAAVRQRAASLAREVFERNPNHPGAAHYLIHALDTPELAHLALPAARAYAKIAPAAFHARHMPAHIFARLGLWQEAIASCQSAWDASVAWSQRENLSANHHDYHSLSWLVEMNFELGLRKAADAAMETFAASVRKGLNHSHRAAYALQVTSYMARTGEWARVDELLAPLDAAPADDEAPAPAPPVAASPQASASSCASHGPQPPDSPLMLLAERAATGARARSAAERRATGQTRRFLAHVDALNAKLRPFLVATQPAAQLAKIDETSVHAREALLALSRGDDRSFLEAERWIADREDEEFSGEGAGTGNLPRERVAAALLRLGKPKDALAQYELALRRHPRRASSLLGAARAAARTGDPDTARRYYQELAELWADADPTLEGLAEVRAATANLRTTGR